MEEPLNQIGPYSIKKKLAEGGMGAVYLGLQESLNRTVAIKVLPAYLMEHGEFIERFEREAKIVAQLSHPNIIHVIDRGQWEDKYYFVMEYVDGEALDDILKERKKLPWKEALAIVTQVCEALVYAHEKGIVHRDIKPANVLLDQGKIAKVTDFGIAYAQDEVDRLTMTSASMGTPNYMAPEQRVDAKSADERADIYGLGVMLYEMVTGKLPHGRFELPGAIVSGIPPAMDRVVEKCLQADPKKRFSSAALLKKELGRCLLDAPATSRGPLWIGGGLAACAALVAALVLWGQKGDVPTVPRDPPPKPTAVVIAEPLHTPEGFSEEVGTQAVLNAAPPTPPPKPKPRPEPKGKKNRSSYNPRLRDGIIALDEDRLTDAKNLALAALDDKGGLPDDQKAKAYYIVASADHGTGFTKEAIQGYEKYIELAPEGRDIDEVKLMLGVDLMKTASRNEEGLALIVEAIEAGVSTEDAAVEIFGAASQRLFAGSGNMWIIGEPRKQVGGKGSVLEGAQSGHLEAASALLQVIVDRCGDTKFHEMALFELGKIHAAPPLREPQKSIDCFELLLASYPETDLFVEMDLGTVYEETHKITEAIATYRKLIDRFPDTPQARYALQRIEKLEKQ